MAGILGEWWIIIKHYLTSVIEVKRLQNYQEMKISRNRFIYEKIALLTNVGSFLVHDIRATSQNGLDIGLPVAGTNSCQ